MVSGGFLNEFEVGFVSEVFREGFLELIESGGIFHFNDEFPVIEHLEDAVIFYYLYYLVGISGYPPFHALEELFTSESTLDSEINLSFLSFPTYKSGLGDTRGNGVMDGGTS